MLAGKDRHKKISRGVALFLTVLFATTSSSCLFNSRITSCEMTGRRCQPGQTCAARQDACIEIGGCGDGKIDPARGEICDDGNIEDGDGCSANCMSDETCGNLVLDTAVGEICDHGQDNGQPGDICSEECMLIGCGNGAVDLNEECDPGMQDSRACNSPSAGMELQCTISKCGDGYRNAAADEECDTGMELTVSCNSPIRCTKPECGDGIFNPAFGEQCDTRGDSTSCNGNKGNHKASCHMAACGDGYLNTLYIVPDESLRRGHNEECDDGGNSPNCNGNDNLTGSGNCQPAICGDGYLNKLHVIQDESIAGSHLEECDEKVDTVRCNGDGNSSHIGSCQHATCGDGYVNTKNLILDSSGGHFEVCDDGGDSSSCNGNANDNGIGNCLTPYCGDGYVNPKAPPPKVFTRTAPGEVCDNGSDAIIGNSNTRANACRTDCQPAFCGDGVVDGSNDEECDIGQNHGDDCDVALHCVNCKCRRTNLISQLWN